MKEPIKILIHVEGGCVTGVEVMVVDHDEDEGMGEEEQNEVDEFAAECPTWVA